jgi:hypothetical protein
MVDQREQTWESKSHFLAIASTAMRRVLLEHARARLAERRVGAGAGAAGIAVGAAPARVSSRATRAPRRPRASDPRAPGRRGARGPRSPRPGLSRSPARTSVGKCQPGPDLRRSRSNPGEGTGLSAPGRGAFRGRSWSAGRQLRARAQGGEATLDETLEAWLGHVGHLGVLGEVDALLGGVVLGPQLRCRGGRRAGRAGFRWPPTPRWPGRRAKDASDHGIVGNIGAGLLRDFVLVTAYAGSRIAFRPAADGVAGG